MTNPKLPITVIIPTRNEERNLPACLASVKDFAQVIVVDSHSSDNTPAIARAAGAEFHSFDFSGGWPKKRQWALESLRINNPWTLLLDADERVSAGLLEELTRITADPNAADGYWVPLRLRFLGRELRHGASDLRKLSLFRTGKARFECLVVDREGVTSDVEIHEHLILDGAESQCRGHLVHENINSMDRYIAKHNEYSSWSAMLVYRIRRGLGPEGKAREARALGNQADRRRWVMGLLWRLPAGPIVLPVFRFRWFYVVRLGFLDGAAGYYYCAFKAVQVVHIFAKVKELDLAEKSRAGCGD